MKWFGTLVALTLFSGCRSMCSEDSFVGTWRLDPSAYPRVLASPTPQKVLDYAGDMVLRVGADHRASLTIGTNIVAAGRVDVILFVNDDSGNAMRNGEQNPFPLNVINGQLVIGCDPPIFLKKVHTSSE